MHSTRLKRFEVAPEIIVHLGSGTYKVVANELPRDVVIEQCYYDSPRGVFVIYLSHPSWDVVDATKMVPAVAAPILERL